MLVIGAAANTLNPNVMHFHQTDAVAFCVIDSFAGDSARGDFQGELHGVVMPLLKWTTRFSPNKTAPIEVESSISVNH
jgi:lipopolysaccharide transport system ATP-binding protein